MGLLELIVLFVVVGLVMWIINTYIPMEARIKNLLNIVVVIVLVLFVLNLFVPFASFANVRVGR